MKSTRQGCGAGPDVYATNRTVNRITKLLSALARSVGAAFGVVFLHVASKRAGEWPATTFRARGTNAILRRSSLVGLLNIGGLALDASNPSSRLGHRLVRIQESNTVELSSKPIWIISV